MRILGIDPGLDGGLAVLSQDGLVIEVMPTLGEGKRTVDANALVEWLRQLSHGYGSPDHAYLELVGAMPGQGVTSMFSFGEGYGVIKGVLVALHIPYTLVSPRKWQGAVLGAHAKGDSKGAAAVRAAQLFPGVNFRASARSRKPHDGMVDAALLAYYGAAQMRGEQALQNLGAGKPTLLSE